MTEPKNPPGWSSTKPDKPDPGWVSSWEGEPPPGLLPDGTLNVVREDQDIEEDE